MWNSYKRSLEKGWLIFKSPKRNPDIQLMLETWLSWSMDWLFWNWENSRKRQIWSRGYSNYLPHKTILPTQLSAVIVNWIHGVYNASAFSKMMLKWNNECNEPTTGFAHNRFWITISLISFFGLTFFLCQFRSGRYNRLFRQGHVFPWRKRSIINNLSLLHLYFVTL